MNQPQRYHANNPLDPRAASGIMYPGEHGDWVKFEDYSALEEKLNRLPADWFEDSSLETWFPITAQEMTRLKAEVTTLRAIVDASVWVCATCGGGAHEHGLSDSTCVWEPVLSSTAEVQP